MSAEPVNAASTPALVVHDLEVDYATARGRVRALRRVDFEVGRGRVVGLVGESGSGKSTLIGAVLRLLAPNAEVAGGSIRLEGRDLLALSEEEMRGLRGRRMSAVFQDPSASLNPVLSIGAQIVDFQHGAPGSRREKRARAAAMLARVGIADPEERLRQTADQLSGGMRQRVAIAMALLSRPALLIADEPTTALDATMKAQILALLRELQAEIGCAVLFVSHHLGAVAQLCDEVVVMYAGEVVERGPVREVFQRPGHPYTRRLIECDPARLPGRVAALPTIPGTVPDPAALPAGCVFAPRCREVFARCHVEVPPHHPLGPSHTASCHLLDEEAPR